MIYSKIWYLFEILDKSNNIQKFNKEIYLLKELLYSKDIINLSNKQVKFIIRQIFLIQHHTRTSRKFNKNINVIVDAKEPMDNYYLIV